MLDTHFGKTIVSNTTDAEVRIIKEVVNLKNKKSSLINRQMIVITLIGNRILKNTRNEMCQMYPMKHGENKRDFRYNKTKHRSISNSNQ